MPTDKLKEILKNSKDYSSSSYIPIHTKDFFRDANAIDTEHFGLTFSQRMTCFAICMLFGLLSFIYSLMNILSAFVKPTKFAFPYAISNLIFFFMMGFVFGFKTYLKNVFSKKRRNYTLFFIVITILTLYCAISIQAYLFNFALAMLQIVSFVVFSVSFIPGGSHGLSAVMTMVVNK